MWYVYHVSVQSGWQVEVNEKFKTVRAKCNELHLREDELIEKRKRELQ